MNHAAKEPIFVFGSNEAGIHGAGAAKYAYQTQGARYGKGYGHYGNSFAIPTKDANLVTLPMSRISKYIHGFIAYAEGHPYWTFKVTRVGCGLAGLEDEVVANRFQFAPSNCQFDTAWFPYLGSNFTYWGTF